MEKPEDIKAVRESIILWERLSDPKVFESLNMPLIHELKSIIADQMKAEGYDTSSINKGSNYCPLCDRAYKVKIPVLEVVPYPECQNCPMYGRFNGIDGSTKDKCFERGSLYVEVVKTSGRVEQVNTLRYAQMFLSNLKSVLADMEGNDD